MHSAAEHGSRTDFHPVLKNAIMLDKRTGVQQTLAANHSIVVRDRMCHHLQARTKFQGPAKQRSWISERHGHHAASTQEVMKTATNMAIRIPNGSDETECRYVLLLQPGLELLPAGEKRCGWKWRLEARCVINKGDDLASKRLQYVPINTSLITATPHNDAFALGSQVTPSPTLLALREQSLSPCCSDSSLPASTSAEACG